MNPADFCHGTVWQITGAVRAKCLEGVGMHHIFSSIERAIYTPGMPPSSRGVCREVAAELPLLCRHCACWVAATVAAALPSVLTLLLLILLSAAVAAAAAASVLLWFGTAVLN
jgi:hypothetical protein